ncbi:MAG: trypsin-like peptidase domain-containing protein [Acidobacteriota bacterium]|nr:trypsin-like peptidase domain-containing protein [Acidobacteriota bacterium]
MPDPGPGLSRLCPACGRRVPRSVALCRCGAGLPALDDGPPEAQDPPTRGLTAMNLAAGLLLLAAVAATGYWSFTRPPAAAPQGPAARRGVAEGGFLPLPATNGPPLLFGERGNVPANADNRAPEADPLPPVAEPEAATPLEDVVGRVLPAVVLVETSSGRGSGFYVRPDTLITNLHVVKSDGFVKLRRTDGTTVTARVDLRSPAHDLAILRVTAPAADQVVIDMGTADTLRPGQEVINIGSPFGTLRNSVTRGIVSGIRRSGVATMIQNDATAHPGNSGGPLLDRNGVAVGITTGGENDKPGIHYAVAIDHAREILGGRLADSTAPPLAIRDVKAVDPASSEPQRVIDERAFTAAVARIAATADALDVEWTKFREACYTGTVPGSTGREWLVMLSPRPITPSQVSFGACATFVTGVQAEANRLRAAMRGALDSARRAGVLPGTIRDALQANRLEFDWDR